MPSTNRNSSEQKNEEFQEELESESEMNSHKEIPVNGFLYPKLAGVYFKSPLLTRSSRVDDGKIHYVHPSQSWILPPSRSERCGHQICVKCSHTTVGLRLFIYELHAAWYKITSLLPVLSAWSWYASVTTATLLSFINDGNLKSSTALALMFWHRYLPSLAPTRFAAALNRHLGSARLWQLVKRRLA
jgi:hypothetical protein